MWEEVTIYLYPCVLDNPASHGVVILWNEKLLFHVQLVAPDFDKYYSDCHVHYYLLLLLLLFHEILASQRCLICKGGLQEPLWLRLVNLARVTDCLVPLHPLWEYTTGPAWNTFLMPHNSTISLLRGGLLFLHDFLWLCHCVLIHYKKISHQICVVLHKTVATKCKIWTLFSEIPSLIWRRVFLYYRGYTHILIILMMLICGNYGLLVCLFCLYACLFLRSIISKIEASK